VVLQVQDYPVASGTVDDAWAELEGLLTAFDITTALRAISLETGKIPTYLWPLKYILMYKDGVKPTSSFFAVLSRGPESLKLWPLAEDVGFTLHL
jgi:hypothetical protein